MYISHLLSDLRRRFQENTSPTYCPELALICSHPITEIWSSLDSILGLRPCGWIYELQRVAELNLDLACESAPRGLLTTNEERQHLEDAKRVQERVLELTAAQQEGTEPVTGLAIGLILLAKLPGDMVMKRQETKNLQRHHSWQVLSMTTS